MKTTAIAFSLMILSSIAFADVKSAGTKSLGVKADVKRIERTLDQCLANPDNQSTYGMNECINQGYGAMDQVLNVVYKAARRELQKPTGDSESDQQNREIYRRLTVSQRAWVTFRDANSELNGIEMLGGSGESQLVLGSLFDMTKKRVLELDSYQLSLN